MQIALPGDPVAPRYTAPQVIDSLVDAILDALDPNAVQASHRLSFGNSLLPQPVVIVGLNGVQFELSIDSWARALSELGRRSRTRPMRLPSLDRVATSILDAGQDAMRAVAAYTFRTAH